MRDVVRRFDSLSSFVRIVLSAVGQAVPFYGAAWLGTSVSEVAKRAGVPGLLVHGAVVTLLLSLILAVRGYFAEVRRQLALETEKRRATIERAHDLVDRIVSESLVDIVQDADNASREILFSSRTRLNRIVRAVYELFEGAYGSGSGGGTVNFEATFMTKSYGDGKITIPAFGNKDNRAPHSLRLRAEKPDIYEQTATALIYRQSCPAVKIIEDTAKDDTYNALYEGQKSRIKSTIIYPVRDTDNNLLGTLVIHCDLTGFFTKGQEKYWTRLLEVFSKRLAHEKAKMDRAEMARTATASVTVDLPQSPF